MRKILAIVVVMLCGALQLNAQKIGYINTEKILSVIPEYKAAQTQLESLSKTYQSKIEAEYEKIETLYNNYQSMKANLTAQARQMKENEIIEKERAVKELQKSYFGQDGAMQKKSQELMDPIKERVDSAINKIAASGDFMIIFDTASLQGVAYVNEKDDLSNYVIKALGY